MLGKIRLIFVTKKYAATLAFYREGLDHHGARIGPEVADIASWYQRARENQLEISQELSTLPWGEQGFTLVDPNGIGVYIYSVIEKEDDSPEADGSLPYVIGDQSMIHNGE